MNGFLLLVAPVTWWDSQRWQWLPSFWQRSHTSYGGLTLVHAGDLLVRLEKWVELLQLTMGSTVLLVLLVIALLAILAHGLRNGVTCRAGRFDLLLVAFILGYLLVHLAFTLAPWDRYALPLVPLLSLVRGRGLSLIVHDLGQTGLLRGRGKGIGHAVGLPVLVFCLIQGIWLSLPGKIPVGDARAYDGAALVATYVRSHQPADAVLYHHWLGWHYQFYLHDSQVELRWWESVDDLAAKARSDPARVQLIALPAGREAATWLPALAKADVQLVPLLQVHHADGSPSLTLHRLELANPGASPS